MCNRPESRTRPAGKVDRLAVPRHPREGHAATERTLVAIENQLEWSDVDHMGRLLIYAAGCDARVAIWVAPDFMYEHAKTIHWLNEWTSKKIKLYCVKVEVVKQAEGSDPQAQVPQGGVPRRLEQNSDAAARAASSTGRPETPRLLPAPNRGAATVELRRQVRVQYASTHTDRSFPSRIDPRVRYIVSLEGPQRRLGNLLISGWLPKRRPSSIFNKLYADHEGHRIVHRRRSLPGLALEQVRQLLLLQHKRQERRLH